MLVSAAVLARRWQTLLSAKFFGLFNTGQQVAGIAGAFLFALVGQLSRSGGLGILSVALCLIVGPALLLYVDQTESWRVTVAADAEPAPAGSL